MTRGKVTAYMVAVNYFALVYLVAGATIVWVLSRGAVSGILLALAWIYLLPPLLCRVILIVFGRPRGPAEPRSRSYRVWWFLMQLQVIFNRFPSLEELLRLVPGLYGLWLNLWGSRVSLMAYWSPGVLPTDRYMLSVGKGAVLGARCLLGGHIVSKTPDGEYLLTLGDVRVGDRAVVGAHSLLGPGSRVCADEVVPAGRTIPPNTEWIHGRRRPIRRGETPDG